MSVRTQQRTSSLTGTHLPSWWHDRPARCQCCGVEIPTETRYCDRCHRATEPCPTCHGLGFSERWIAGAPETEHCTRCANTGRVSRKAA